MYKCNKTQIEVLFEAYLALNQLFYRDCDQDVDEWNEALSSFKFVRENLSKAPITNIEDAFRKLYCEAVRFACLDDGTPLSKELQPFLPRVA
ncbi:hypothetical protein [Bartonella sp. DGB1]|uniref:hypothetical protein n=1 Tax=Bartonella sp. DGB1 TaxID=3239807 RepID=UPI003525381E